MTGNQHVVRPTSGRSSRLVRLSGLGVALCAAVCLVVGCADKRPKDGSERGDCYGNGTCDEGLLCLSNLCVRPPPADCDKVVKKLGFLSLGNYTPQKAREEFHKRVVATCRAAKLTKDEGDCLLAARSKRDISQCKKPLILADCQRMFDHVKNVVGPSEPDLVRELTRDPARSLRKCREELYTKVDEACVLAAKTKRDLEGCKL